MHFAHVAARAPPRRHHLRRRRPHRSVVEGVQRQGQGIVGHRVPAVRNLLTGPLDARFLRSSSQGRQGRENADQVLLLRTAVFLGFSSIIGVVP